MIVDKIQLPKNYNRPKCPMCEKTAQEFLIDVRSIIDSEKEIFKFFVENGLVIFQGNGEMISSEAIIFMCIKCMDGEDCSWLRELEKN